MLQFMAVQRVRINFVTEQSTENLIILYLVTSCIVRPPKVAVLLPSLQPLLNQCIPHLYSAHVTDFSTHLPQAPTSDNSYQKEG